jgi:hypothetical protein
VGGIFAVPAALFLFLDPDWGVWSSRLKVVAYVFMFSLGGLGALLAILTRVGVVRMIYSEGDKQSRFYKIKKGIAERERDGEFGFSDRYFESLDVKSSRNSEPDKP